MKNLDIGIVIVNFNCGSYILECLESIKKNNFLLSNVIIVDNNSSDESVEKIVKSFPDIVILYSDYNSGFSGGCNIGIKYALENNYKNVFLLNPDTILSETFFESIYKNLDNYCLLVPQVLNHNNSISINNNGGLNFYRGITSSKNINDSDCTNEEYCYLKMSSACAILIPKLFFSEVGFFDENYFLYWEDTDLIYRGLKSGFRIKLILKSKLFHDESSSSGGKKSLLSLYYNYRNRLYFMTKHSSRFYQFSIFKLYFASTLFINFCILFFKGEFSRIGIIIKAIYDFKNNKLGFSDLTEYE